MSLGTDNCLGLLCDIRNPGVESLIKVHCLLHWYMFIGI